MKWNQHTSQTVVAEEHLLVVDSETDAQNHFSKEKKTSLAAEISPKQ